VARVLELSMGALSQESESNLGVPRSEAWDWEDLIAHSRLVLGVVCTITVCLYPASLGRHPDLGRRLILLYLTYGLLNLIVIRVRWHYGAGATVLLHVVDIVLISLITASTGGVQSTFLGLYLFVLLAAACKWGFNGALLTAGVCVAFLFSNLALLASWLGGAPHSMVEGSTFLATMALSAGLVSSACLLGLLVEREQRRYGDGVAIARLVRGVIPEPSFKEALGNTLKSVREFFDADQVRLVLQELRGEKSFAWDVDRQTGKIQEGIRSWKLTETVRQERFAMAPVGVQRGLGLGRTGLAGGNQQIDTCDGLASGLARRSHRAKFDDGFDDLHIVSEEHSPFVGSWSMLATSFSFAGKWLGRLTVYNPRRGRSARAGLQFLETLVREVGPAMLNKFTVGRLRSRAQARERVRLVQELHDGIVQSLIGLEMQIDHLRRVHTAACNPASLLEELRRLQTLLHDEIASVREEMQRIKPLQVDPGRLLEYLARTVERFQRDQGINARFVAEDQEVSLSPAVCTELARIVQEALVNVRKHSGARNVLVSFGRENGHYRLFVEDDGRGFGFTGHKSSAELDASAYCPAIVRERVRAIGGELMIESNQSSGARLEILVPLTPNGRIASDS
jgi:signal transduction histidine kinase